MDGAPTHEEVDATLKATDGDAEAAANLLFSA